jgi:hypothetical protein
MQSASGTIGSYGTIRVCDGSKFASNSVAFNAFNRVAMKVPPGFAKISLDFSLWAGTQSHLDMLIDVTINQVSHNKNGAISFCYLFCLSVFAEVGSCQDLSCSLSGFLRRHCRRITNDHSAYLASDSIHSHPASFAPAAKPKSEAFEVTVVIGVIWLALR